MTLPSARAAPAVAQARWALANPLHRRAGTLRRSLIALVLVPVLGLVGLMAYAVDEQARRAQTAETAADDVAAAVALDAVRAAVAREVVPVLGQAVLDDPRTAASVGVDERAVTSLCPPWPAPRSPVRPSPSAATPTTPCGRRGRTRPPGPSPSARRRRWRSCGPAPEAATWTPSSPATSASPTTSRTA